MNVAIKEIEMSRNLQMLDLRTIKTGVRLTRAERLAAEQRHLAAKNDAQLVEKKARNARRGLVPMKIGMLYVPPHVARHYQHSGIGGV